MFTRRDTLFLASGLAVAAVAPARADTPPVFAEEGLAMRGYDPVAYFKADAPAPGKFELTHEWNGATWLFASAENLADFAANPEAYAPQYGGYCAWAVARNYTASTVPDAWHIHDGRLFLNYSLRVRRRWRRDVPGNVARGDANWPAVLEG